MSKHSMRRGSDGSPRTDCNVSSASYCAAVAWLKRVLYARAALRVASSTSPRFSPRCGTTMRTRRPARSDSHVSRASRSSGSVGTWMSGGAGLSS